MPSHRGSGAIAVEHDGTAVRWHERGRWETGPLAGTAFCNRTRWTMAVENGALELAHERRGSPVFLVALREERVGLLRSAAPHVCGEDRYTARLRWSPRGLALIWEVAGKRLSYTLIVRACPFVTWAP
ncbi:MAG TPA: DUF6314 family protein [Gemmatimonadales bacterium]|nr:DUF6314 family protein [Gemmatimonadales bacterium]